MTADARALVDDAIACWRDDPDWAEHLLVRAADGLDPAEVLDALPADLRRHFVHTLFRVREPIDVRGDRGGESLARRWGRFRAAAFRSSPSVVVLRTSRAASAPPPGDPPTFPAELDRVD